MATVSSERGALAKKISAIVKDIGYIEKTGKNKDQGYNYASAALVFDEVNAAAHKLGVAIIATCNEIEHTEITSKSGTRGLQTTMKVTVEFIDGDTGYTLGGTFPAVGVDYGDKSASKAITAGRRHAVLGFLGIPTGTDPDEKDPEPQAAPPSIESCYRVWSQQNKVTDHTAGKAQFKDWARAQGFNVTEPWTPSPADRLKIGQTLSAGK